MVLTSLQIDTIDQPRTDDSPLIKCMSRIKFHEQDRNHTRTHCCHEPTCFGLLGLSIAECLFKHPVDPRKRKSRHWRKISLSQTQKVLDARNLTSHDSNELQNIALGNSICTHKIFIKKIVRLVKARFYAQHDIKIPM